ncbi:unnamed protein product [Bursaphelenchus xylophilus]|uniref:Putative alpha-L-fucosidase n=1 Tax=Bursaphelenchus xylophilus TaxID=6326 RepID=A0A1I7RRA4_BURXY|nr:unnamed protein product [Bursaphelenchus xylophilus]CAG9130896.1 unnamed protein product [Bursaphelenchus xylophilus]
MLILLLFCGLGSVLSNYTPDWKSLDSRPLPSWYDDSKLGIFVHWGVFSVPAFKSEWIWWFWKQGYSDVVNFMNKNFPGQSYADLGSKFTAADFNADSFLSIVKSSGAKYIVVTTKHHEGYTLWPSETSFNWNSVDLGPHRDLVREFRDSTLKQGLHFGTYFSQFDWFHPLYLKDNANKTREYPEKVSLVQMRELINNYKPEVLWSDGDWEKSDDYWGAKEFLAWVFNDSPVKESIVVNDRWGKGIPYNHGSFITGNDGYMPGKLLTKKWECCSSLIRGSFGYRRNLRSGDVETSKETIDKFVKILAWGGNLLLNIGPDQYGNIPAILEERLQEVGAFVNANSEAIYGSKPWIYQNDTEKIWYTSKLTTKVKGFDHFNPQIEGNTIIYAFLLDWDKEVQLKSVKSAQNIKVTLLGTGIALNSTVKEGVLTVTLPPEKKFPHRDAIVLKIENAANDAFHPQLMD